ncbi:MAG: tail fiber domain-containing protein [Crocinitomicaceae bacterium]
MKKAFLIFSFSTFGFAFGQDNYSSNPVLDPIPTSSLGSDEIFRFQSGAFTQLQGATVDFTFGTTDRWLSIGQVPTGGIQTFYGSRFQYDGSALVTGYTSTSPKNPRIQWIGNSSVTPIGNLEFRVGDGFGASGSPGTNTLVASMTPEGRTYFGNANPSIFNPSAPKVGIGSDGLTGLDIQLFGNGTKVGENIKVVHTSTGNAIFADCIGGENSTTIFAKANASDVSIGVQGRINANPTTFGAAIFGEGYSAGSGWAGYFDGDVFCTGSYLPSDEKLKQNVTKEKDILKRISLLNPVTYTYKKIDGIILPEVNQHGFISQELAEVFPELTKDVKKPIFDEEGKVTSEITFKSINYVGLISVLTGAVQELNTELQAVRQELDDYKANDNVRSQLMQNNNAVKGYSMEQNTPNPFDDRSIIRYELAPGVNQASITIFNLNGGLVKDYPINQNKGEITISAAEIGKGMFIYSLTQNGQEILSKRMIVK